MLHTTLEILTLAIDLICLNSMQGGWKNTSSLALIALTYEDASDSESELREVSG